MIHISAKKAAREQNALDAGKKFLCDCGMDLTAIAQGEIEQFFEEEGG